MDLLVLLVGTNPLPAWVTFSALHTHAPDDLKPRRVLLIHSRDTADQAARLESRIRQRVPDVFRTSVGDDAGDPLAIRAEVRRGLAHFRGVRTVLLDYTGGTKQMAVQAFAACRGLVGTGGIAQVRGGYLDANLHRLRFDDDSGFPVTGDMRRLCDTHLDDLLDMHGCALRKSGGSSQPLWSRTARAIWEAVSATDGRAEAYASWKGQFRRATEADSEGLKPDLPPGFELPQGPLAPIAEAFLGDVALLPERDNVVPWEAIYEHFRATNSKGRTRARENTQRFFDGSWLETLLTCWIQERLSTKSEAELQWNVYAERSGSRIPAELDVVMLRGYQMFLFSCTTSPQREYVKNKAFEAIHRARQFGGDEARSLLVTLLPYELPPKDQHPSVKGLQDDIESDTGGRYQLRIWGINELRAFDSTWADLLREERLS